MKFRWKQWHVLTGVALMLALMVYSVNGYYRHIAAVYGSLENKRIIDATLEKKRDTHRNPGHELQFKEEKFGNGENVRYGQASLWLEHDRLHQANRQQESIFDTVVEIGPESVGGRTRAIHIDPLNSDHILAGGVSGGIWTSTDRGFSWTVLNDKAANLTVTGITYNPFHPGMIYYSTGEPRGGGGLGEGIFKSTDNGASFEQLPSSLQYSDFRYTWDIVHSLTDSLTVFVCTIDGLYRTTDGGESWEKVLDSNQKDVNDALVFEDGSILAAVEETGLFYSPSGDAGTFSQFPTANFPEAFTRIKLAYCATQKNYVYAMLAIDTNDEEAPLIYSSNDFGQTWTQKSTPITASTQRRYNMMLGVHPTLPNKVVCGAVLSNYSNDGGDSWFFTGLSHSDYHEYISFPDNPAEFLVGNDGGIHLHRWNDIFRVSARNTGYNVTQFYSGSYDPLEEHVMGGTQDNGTIRMKQGQSSYIFGADGGYAHVDQVESNRAYYSTQNSGLFRTDNWKQGIPIPTDIMYRPMADEGVSFINPYEMNYADASQLYYRTNAGVWRTTNRGNTWTKLNDQPLEAVRRMAVTDEHDPFLYLVAQTPEEEKFIYQNRDASTTLGLEPVFTLTGRDELSNTTTVSLDVHPNNQQRLLLAYYNYTGEKDQVWFIDRLAEDGAQLISVTGNLPENLPVNAIKFHPDRPDDCFIAATDFGLYYTTDAGITWIKEDRMPNVQIADIRIRKSDGAVFAYTFGRGIWAAYLSPTASPAAELPVAVSFESGNWSDFSYTDRSDPGARVKVYPQEGYHLRLDMSAELSFSHSASWTIRVNVNAGRQVQLAYDVYQPGEKEGCTIGVSYDGGESFETLRTIEAGEDWQRDSVLLQPETTGEAQLRFTYFGDREFPNGGFALDNISIAEMPVTTAVLDAALNEVELYPNPAVDRVTIAGLKDIGVSQAVLVNAGGQVLQEWQYRGERNWSLELPNSIGKGTYYLRFEKEGRTLGWKPLVIVR